jgi:choline dehydrogenase-like flavoprotein
MQISKTEEGMVLVRGIGQGGTTTISAGNAVRQDRDLKAIGINLDAEFQELEREIAVTTSHQKAWHQLTRETYSICQKMGLQPQPTPKMVQFKHCVSCGKCVLGCSHGAKWDSRVFLSEAIGKGAEVISGWKVKKAVIEKGKVTGVAATNGWQTRVFPADLVILAAGGMGTPVILQETGIECQPRLFVDPVLCVATRWDKVRQNSEIPMPFIVQKEHFIISPYFDFLSFFFNRDWRFPAGDIFSLMIKLADSNSGNISSKGVKKNLQLEDRSRLEEGVSYCREILHQLGKKDSEIFPGTLNAGHPGGMLPLTEKDSLTLHPECLPANLYVADASLLPGSTGNPLILTIAALAKRVCKSCLDYA